MGTEVPAIVRLYQSQMRENGKVINLSNFFLLCCNKSQHNLPSLYNDVFFLFPVFLTASFLPKPNRNYDFQKQKKKKKENWKNMVIYRWQLQFWKLKSNNKADWKRIYLKFSIKFLMVRNANRWFQLPLKQNLRDRNTPPVKMSSNVFL